MRPTRSHFLFVFFVVFAFSDMLAVFISLISLFVWAPSSSFLRNSRVYHDCIVFVFSPNVCPFTPTNVFPSLSHFPSLLFNHHLFFAWPDPLSNVSFPILHFASLVSVQFISLNWPETVASAYYLPIHFPSQFSIHYPLSCITPVTLTISRHYFPFTIPSPLPHVPL